MKKPNKEELMLVIKAAAIGIAVIGVMGFIIATIMRFVDI